MKFIACQENIETDYTKGKKKHQLIKWFCLKNPIAQIQTSDEQLLFHRCL